MDEDMSPLPENHIIYDLVDVVEEKEERMPLAGTIDDEITGIVAKVAEKIAREMFPSIAEKVIREEIDKMKENPSR